ncbi:MAG: hypothetical protein HKN60_03940 [Rhizobiales bacterium]|nr:hypothetical protein [Hyphomicrobiales bacterium]
MLADRFRIDGNLTPCELDGSDPGEPGRYDYADIQEAHALAHVPLWLIDASQVKLIFDYGFGGHSTFCLGLLMLERDPFRFVEGSVYGDLLPSIAKGLGVGADKFRIEAMLALLGHAEALLPDPAHDPTRFKAQRQIVDSARAAVNLVLAAESD